MIAKCQEGTGKWFVESAEFAAWVEGRRPTLLCPGIPGAGKTFMSAIAVDWLSQRFPRREEVGIAVLYCSYSMQNEQTKEKLLARLLRQLINHGHCESEKLRTLYEELTAAKRRPSLDVMAGLFRHVAGTFSRVFVVIDALDECKGLDWTPVVAGLRRLQTLIPALRLLMTFRPHVTFGEEMAEAATLSIRADSWDLKQYVAMGLSQLSKHVRENDYLRREVIKAIVDTADGM